MYSLSGNSRAGGLDRGEATDEQESERASGHDGLRLENEALGKGRRRRFSLCFDDARHKSCSCAIGALQS